MCLLFACICLCARVTHLAPLSVDADVEDGMERLRAVTTDDDALMEEGRRHREALWVLSGTTRGQGATGTVRLVKLVTGGELQEKNILL